MVFLHVMPGRLLENRLTELNFVLWIGSHQERRWERVFQAEGAADTEAGKRLIASTEQITNVSYSLI